jgi:hypothetical protein
VVVAEAGEYSPTPERGRWVRVLRGSPATWRRATSQPALLLQLALVAAGYAGAAVVQPRWFPVATACLWIMLGGFFLRVRYLVTYFAVVAAAVWVAVSWRDQAVPSPGVLMTLAVTALLVLLYARSRERVGIQGRLGDTMLVDLRDRLLAQGRVPPLQPGWQIESVLRPAYGDAFSGDFLVADGRPDGWVELALVDVSGKGRAAGSRALMLSGAFGGLLGAMPRPDFLPAANRYLLRQGWDEGFATAVHVAIDQGTGAYEVRSAGHPPAAHYHSGSGRWEIVDDGQGPLLGVIDNPGFPAHIGRLRHGDALIFYTDGLVEARDRGIDLGIDRLVGAAEPVVGRDAAGGARRIVDASHTGESDDRALVLIRRS